MALQYGGTRSFRPCRRCGCTERYISNRRCPACHHASAERYRNDSRTRQQCLAAKRQWGDEHRDRVVAIKRAYNRSPKGRASGMACECVDNEQAAAKERNATWLPIQLIASEALLHIRSMAYHPNGKIAKIEFYP